LIFLSFLNSKTDKFAVRIIVNMNQQLQSVGVDFRSAPLVIREKLAFNETTSKLFLKKLSEVYGVSDAMILSTCNRTEIYFSGTQTHEEILKLACVEKGISYSEVEEYMIVYYEDEAVKHLFEVSLGLDAKVLGDIQIINQVKNAYQWSAEEGMAGPILHRLMHTIFYANKRIVQETEFRDGSGSVASVAVSLINTVSSLVENPRVLLVGTGEIGQNVIENLKGQFKNVAIINRTFERAEQLANQYGYDVTRFENLDKELFSSDVIISAVSADKPIISKNSLQHSLTPKLFIDLGVPRSISSNIEEVNGAMLYNVDQIEEKATQTLEKREQALPAVRAILQEHLSEFNDWSKEMVVSPTIKLFKEKLEEIRKEELAKYMKKASPEEYKLLNAATKNMIQKVIKLPVLELKAACKRGEADTLVDALHEIFNLEAIQKAREES